MKYYYIQFNIENKIAFLNFHRLDKLNAINFDMVKEINHALSNLNTKDVNALFVLGHLKAFSAGGDLKEMQNLKQAEAEKRGVFIHKTFRMVENLNIPTLAFIQGICFGGGLEFALHCDIRICSEESRFAFPEIKYGMIPGAGGTVNFPLKVGKSAAAYYLLTGEEFTPSEAFKLNLVQKVILGDDFEGVVKGYIKLFSEADTESLKAIKKQLLDLNPEKIQENYNNEVMLFSELLIKNGKIGIDKNFLK